MAKFKNVPLKTIIASYKSQNPKREPRKCYRQQLLSLASQLADLRDEPIDLEINTKYFRFYTYIYLNPLKPGKFRYVLPSGKVVSFDFEPFYAGKGSGERKITHIKEAATSKENNRKLNTIRKILRAELEPIVIHIPSRVSNYMACAFEIDLIAGIGRRDLKIGPLSNLTDGGEGVTGLILSDEVKHNISIRQTHEWASLTVQERCERGNKIREGKKKYPKVYTQDERAAAVIRSTGRLHTKKTKTKMQNNAALRDEDYYSKNMHSPEARAKAGVANKGNTYAKGSIRSAEFKANVSKFQTGQVRSPKTRAKISETKRNQPDVTCPHCGKIGHPSGMKSWHFDNCKLKE